MADLVSTLSPMARNVVKPDAPGPMKLMAASGRIPLPPKDLILVLYLLAQDSDDRVAQEAQRSFKNQPTNIIKPLMESPKTPGELLDFGAKVFSDNGGVLSPILLNKSTQNDTFVWLASRVQGTSLQMILQNQVRHIQEPRIVQSLLKNDGLTEAERSRIIEFALREDIETGMGIDDLIPYALDADFDDDDFMDGLLEEADVDEVSEDEAHTLLDLETIQQRVAREQAEQEARQKEAQEQQQTQEEKPPEDINQVPEDWKEDLYEEEVAEPETEAEPEKKLSLEQQILTWSIPKKVKAALMGNKQLRTLLIRDSNKLVSGAVMRNPGLNDGEVLKIAANPAMSEDVIRAITRNRQWMKSYSMKLALVNNPKTPLPIAMRLVSSLRMNDLKSLMKNRNVSNTISTAARRLFKKKEK